ncbi:hypothetical protein LINGRAHAP2_LOCUS12680, partial [Linum grandiflorum]
MIVTTRLQVLIASSFLILVMLFRQERYHNMKHTFQEKETLFSYCSQTYSSSICLALTIRLRYLCLLLSFT